MLAPRFLLSIVTVWSPLITTSSEGEGTYPASQVAGFVKLPVATEAISEPPVLETNEILSIAAGGFVPPPLPLLHIKINLTVVPAKLAGINPKAFCVTALILP